jgi:hypothetical protein
MPFTLTSRWLGQPGRTHGLGGDEQFRYRARREPGPVVLDRRDNIRRLACNRQLTRPDKCREARLTLPKRCSVGRHFLVGEFANDALRQNCLDEEILLEHHTLAVPRSERAKDRVAAVRKVLPEPWLNDGLHVGDGPHSRGVTSRPVKTQG